MNETLPQSITDSIEVGQMVGQEIIQTNGHYQTIGIAAIFVLGVLSGLLIFKIFSSKWHS